MLTRKLSLDDREAGGYRYRDHRFNIVHTSSVPRSDEDALAYFPVVQRWFGGRVTVQYIEKRPINSGEFQFIPCQFLNGEVEQFESASS